jgi:hypothetical protein
LVNLCDVASCVGDDGGASCEADDGGVITRGDGFGISLERKRLLLAAT